MRDELSFEARELFRASREALGPSDFDLARMRRRVRIAVAGGTGAAALAKTSAASASGHAIAVTCAIAATLAGGGVALWAVTRTSSSPVAPQHVAAPRVEPAPVVEPLPPPPIPEVVVEPPAAPPLEATPPARVVMPRPAPVIAPPAVAADSLATELAILRSADDALRHADPARSLAIVRSAHATQLAAELAAIEIDALCALARTDQAHERAEAFFVRWPRSALRDRITHSCGGHR